MENETNPTAFRTWFAAVNKLSVAKFGIRFDELPDLLPYRDAFDAGSTPEEFFDEEVVPMMKEEFGSLVDDLDE